MERDKDRVNNVTHLLSAFSFRYIEDEKKNLKRNIDAVLNVPGRNIQRLHWQQLLQLMTQLDLLSKQLASRSEHQLQRFGSSLTNSIQLVNTKKQELIHFEEKVALLDPANTLRRGYSITRANGKAITDSSKVKAGSQIETILADGSIISIVEKINP
jgi:exonuclease VII large subunit